MKKESKKLYIIPGFGENSGMETYKKVAEIAANKGIKPIYVDINWSEEKTMSDYKKELLKKIPSQIHDDYIFSFSIGAYLVYNLVKERNFSKYLFCTISPYFKENISEVREKAKDYFNDVFFKDLENFEIHLGSKSKAWFLVEEDEKWKAAVDVSKKACNNWIGESEFILIKDSDHDIGDKKYFKEIKNVIKNKL